MALKPICHMFNLLTLNPKAQSIIFSIFVVNFDVSNVETRHALSLTNNYPKNSQFKTNYDLKLPLEEVYYVAQDAMFDKRSPFPPLVSYSLTLSKPFFKGGFDSLD